jgi:hypothetical protein
MATSRIEGNVYVAGNLNAKTLTLPAGAVSNGGIAAAAGIDASKLEHQHAIHYNQAGATNVAAETRLVHTVRGATGTTVAVEAVLETVPDGDRTVTVDVQKGSAGSEFATILDAVITLDNTPADLEIKSGTISDEDLAHGDTLKVVIAISGSSGSQPQGLSVTITTREDAD